MVAVVAMILIGIAVAIANADAGMPDVQRDLPDVGLPADRTMTAEDVEALKFSMAPRGYRMKEVDEAIARLRDELVARDAEIENLRNPQPDDAEADELAMIIENAHEPLDPPPLEGADTVQTQETRG